MVTDTGHIRELMERVLDPEVPALSIIDLGIFRGVELKDGVFEISITPTFTGCPAMLAIEQEIGSVLSNEGISNFRIKTVMAPAWTTDWMTEGGKRKLKAYGIAPPAYSTEEHLKALISGRKGPVACPFCNSTDTKLTSPFGSTACKALHFCNNCRQPFEEFKCH
jgi:ring-1,2-phenylacetyl-CoA epoxidase subunit PaaD